MAKDPIPYIKLVFLKGFANREYFTGKKAREMEFAGVHSDAINELKTRVNDVNEYFKKEMSEILSFATIAKNNLYDSSAIAKKFTVTLQRIIDRSEIFLRYIEKRDFLDGTAGFLITRDTFILKDIYFEFLEDVGSKINQMLVQGVQPKIIAELKIELRPFSNNKFISKILLLLDRLDGERMPMVNAYFDLTEDDKKQGTIRQIRDVMKKTA